MRAFVKISEQAESGRFRKRERKRSKNKVTWARVKREKRR